MFKKMILKNKPLIFLLIIYTISHILLNNNNFYLNILNPFFWLIFLFIFYQQDLSLFKKKELYLTLIITFIFFILYLLSGFIFGFNKESYNLIQVLINLTKIFFPLYGIEILRYKILKRNNNHFIRFFITFLIILIRINFKVSSYPLYFLVNIISVIAQEMLFTYLSFNSHYKINIIIILFKEIPKIILPSIPFNNWYIEGSFTLIKVLIIYYLYKFFIFKKDLRPYSKLSYILTIIFSFFLVSFMLGLFKFEPIAILSNSMAPTFRKGDVVIYKHTLGDIIVFKQENKTIVHRVVGINNYYITKGDANNTVDYPKVKEDNIKGVYVFHLKYLGYPAIWLNELLSKED